MKTHTYIFVAFALLCGTAHAASSCSRANLTRCMDSVCAINSSMNAAARCQYCGDAGAGSPPESTSGMKNLSVGSSAKYTISAKELKSAPTDDPVARLNWAGEKCLAKVSGCTADDIIEAYQPLIEQSCRAAGITAKMENTIADTAKKKESKDTCNTMIQNCMLADNHCTSSFNACKEPKDFDTHFSMCTSQNSGCDEYLADIRAELTTNRDTVIANAENILNGIVNALRQARETKINTARSDCQGDRGFERCVETVCANNMPSKCVVPTNKDGKKETDPGELVAARALCKFHQLACDALNFNEDKGHKK